MNSPIASWLIDTLAEHGHQTLFQFSIFAHDVIVNVLLAAPFASGLVVRPLNRRLFVLISVVAGIVVSSWGTERSWRAFRSAAHASR